MNKTILFSLIVGISICHFPAHSLSLPLQEIVALESNNLGEAQTELPENNPSIFSISAGFSARLALVRIIGLSLGATARFYWNISEFVSLDLAVMARFLIGYDYSSEVTCLFTLLLVGGWSFKIGPMIGLSYESKLVAFNQDDPIMEEGSYGPFVSVRAGIGIVPLYLKAGKVDVSLLRITGDIEYGSNLFSPSITVDIIELIFHI
jgi:hypothetical protein